MPRSKTQSDEELLEIALDVFLEHGAHVSTHVIAEKAGISQPALFKRFGTKEALFLRAVAPDIEDLDVLAKIDSLSTDDPFNIQLEEMLNVVWDLLTWIMPRIDLLKSARIKRKNVMERYEIAPPDLIIKSIAGFFERAQQRGMIKTTVSPKFAAQWVFGILLGKRFLFRSQRSINTDKERKDFFKATVELLSFKEISNPELNDMTTKT